MSPSSKSWAVRRAASTQHEQGTNVLRYLRHIVHVPFAVACAGHPACLLQHTQQFYGSLRQAIQCVQQLLCRHFLRHEQDVVLSQPSRQGDTRQAQFLQRT
ncbi:MAG: hypothetical protein ACLUF9_10115, partial [Oscillospiraceae bacterium]